MHRNSRVDPKTQARLYISSLNGDLGELPLFADFEDRYGGPFGGWKKWYDFLEELKVLAPGKEIGIYTGPYYWKEMTAMVGIPLASLNYFKQYPLWIAHYGVSAPMIPAPWTEFTGWTFWQNTDNGDGTKYGVESLNIDLNYFNGDTASLSARFGLGEVPPVEPPVEIPPVITVSTMRVTASALNVRSGPGMTSPAIGLLHLNDIVEVVGANADYSWVNVQFGALHGWCSAAYLVPYTVPSPTSDTFCYINYDYDQQWGADFKYDYHVSRCTRNRDVQRFESLPATARFSGTVKDVPMTIGYSGMDTWDVLGGRAIHAFGGSEILLLLIVP